MRLRLLALLAAATFVLSAVPAYSQTARLIEDGPEPTPAAAARIETFETVWRIVNEKFYDPTFNGVDWKAVRERYAPRVGAVESDSKLYELLNQMLGELRASHFHIHPAQSNGPDGIDVDDDSWGGGAGMLVRVVEGRPTITWVDPKGPAAEVGLEPGFVVTAIGSHDAEGALRKAIEREETPTRQRFLFRRAVESWLDGMPGTSIEIAYLDAENRRRTAKVTRTDKPGTPLKFGNLPTYLAQVESRRLEGGVGYLRFNVFLPQLMDEIRSSIRSLGDSRAIVLDLRGNPGGLGFMAPAVAALFLEEASPLGSMKMRNGELRFVTRKQKEPFLGQLVILIDEGSASTSEILAGALQESGRAVVLGERSLGAVLPSVVEKLPNGAIFQYAVADFKTPKGILLEGVGVKPDIALEPTRSAYLTGRDPVLDAALDVIAKRSEATSS